MQIKKFLTAAAAVITLGLAAAPAAQADAWFHAGTRGPAMERRVVVDHRVVFETLRGRHIRYVGAPYFVRGHYVVRSFDRFGRVSFVELNPYTGAFIGFIRL